MDEYRDLDKVLASYDAQQISNGMRAVLEAKKRTMLKMRSTFNPALMDKWGFLPASTATMKRVDRDLLLDYLQINVDANIDSLSDVSMGFMSAEELGHQYLQDTYSEYTVNSRTFSYSDGYIYKYVTSQNVGGMLQLTTYKLPTEAVLLPLLSAYDTVTIDTFSEYLVYIDPDGYMVEVGITYKLYQVTIVKDADGIITTTIYETTIIGNVVEGVVVEGTTTTTTTIVTSQVVGTVYVAPEYLYIGTTDKYDTFIENMISTYSGTYSTSIAGWTTSGTYNKVYGILTPPPTYYDDSAYLITINYSYTSTVTIVDSTTLNVDVVVTASSHPETNSLVEAYEKTRIDTLMQAAAKAEFSNLVVYYTLVGNTYIYYVEPAIASGFLVDVELPTMPIFSLKVGGVLTDNPKMQIALRTMGMTGREFDESLTNGALKYASLGFMFDPNQDNPLTTKLMFETFYHLSSQVMEESAKTTASTAGFVMSYESLSIEVKSTHIIGYVIGTVGTIGKYTSEISTYMVEEQVADIEGGFSSQTVTKVRRIYRKQVETNVYIELNISSLTVTHTYSGTSSTSFKSTNGNYMDLGRIPLLREVLRKLPFNEYLETLQMSMALFVYSSVTVEYKWYQSGLFQFVMLAVAIGAAVYTGMQSINAWSAVFAGTATVTTTLVLGTVATIGAIAGAILAVAAFIGVDLGTFGDALKVIAIIGAVAAVSNLTITMMNTPASTAGVGAATLNGASTELSATANTLIEQGSLNLGTKFQALASEMYELSSQFSITSMGSLGIGEALSPVMSTVESNLANILTTSNIPSVAIPTVSTSMADVLMATFEEYGVTPVLKVVDKVGDIVSQIKSMQDQRELNDMAEDLKKMQDMRDLAQAELDALRETQGRALMLAPVSIDTMYDRLCQMPDPMLGMTDMHASLTVGVETTMEQMIWV
jgi:hypothetical protein